MFKFGLRRVLVFTKCGLGVPQEVLSSRLNLWGVFLDGVRPKPRVLRGETYPRGSCLMRCKFGVIVSLLGLLECSIIWVLQKIVVSVVRKRLWGCSWKGRLSFAVAVKPPGSLLGCTAKGLTRVFWCLLGEFSSTESSGAVWYPSFGGLEKILKGGFPQRGFPGKFAFVFLGCVPPLESAVVVHVGSIALCAGLSASLLSPVGWLFITSVMVSQVVPRVFGPVL